MSMATETNRSSLSTSPLVEKARRLGLSLPEDLERLAVLRGCDYYDRELPPPISPLGEVSLSNEELAVLLLSPALPPSAREIRLAAALLGAPGIRVHEISALSALEKCQGILRYIATCGQRFEPANLFWQELLNLLPDIQVDIDKMPHPTRFVEMTGIDRGRIGMFTRWIRPREELAT